MDRRSLVIRRFGSVDFGLGYFEHGAWIDHTVLADGGASLGVGDGAFAQIHDLLGCCPPPVATMRILEEGRSRPIPVEAGSVGATIGDRREHVGTGTRRSSAG